MCVFTNFWDADTVIGNQFFLLNDSKRQKAYRINLRSTDPKNYSVHSIALSHPDFSKKPNLKNMDRIDCFCPTYDMLKRYKADNDWEAYTKGFIELIKKRKNDMKDWMESLATEHIYFLCCWENTTNGAHCHRDILYKAISESKTMTEKIIPIYRSGGYKSSRPNTIIQNEEMTDRLRGLIAESGGFNFPFNNPPARSGQERVVVDNGDSVDIGWRSVIDRLATPRSNTIPPRQNREYRAGIDDEFIDALFDEDNDRRRE